MGHSDQTAPADAPVASDRRYAPRVPAAQLGDWRTLLLGAGADISLVNVSRSGALFDGQARLSPGQVVTLRFITPEANILMRCRTVRCHVSGQHQGGRLSYRTAVTFDAPLELLETHALTGGIEQDGPAEDGTPEAESPQRLRLVQGSRPAASLLSPLIVVANEW
jgi:hypothetical protein